MTRIQKKDKKEQGGERKTGWQKEEKEAREVKHEQEE